MSATMVPSASTAPLVVDSVTELDGGAAGRVVVCGSHAGAYVATVASRHCLVAIVLNDAGVGREGAGVAGLELLAAAGVAAAAVAADSARIGDGADTLARGEISHANEVARGLGCEPGIAAAKAARLLAGATGPVRGLEISEEAAFELAGPPAPVWALDSISLVGPAHAGAVVMSGSHGGLLGGRARTALKHDVLGAVYNDAGGGREGAGRGRLAPLDQRRIPAAVVAAGSARIGDGRSTYFDGVISAVNETAAALGARPGMAATEFATQVHAARGSDGVDG